MRQDKNNYYLDIAETIAERATCIRRNFGAVIVKNDEIISTGYNGAPRGRVNCTEMKLYITKHLLILEKKKIFQEEHSMSFAVLCMQKLMR